LTSTVTDRVTIPGLTVDIRPDYLHVGSDRPLTTIATAPIGGGFSAVRHFLSVPVPKDLNCWDPSAPVAVAAAALGILESYIGFVTAVKLTNAVVVERADDARRVLVVATVGVTNASRPGEERFELVQPGTINLIVVVEAELPPNALAEALTTTAEAKALTVLEAGVRTKSGLAATGTSTDAYAIACTGGGSREQYAGSVSPIGYLIGRAVRDAVGAGLRDAATRAAGGTR
jgi:adenosylcobinamide amidohydrolase